MHRPQARSNVSVTDHASVCTNQILFPDTDIGEHDTGRTMPHLPNTKDQRPNLARRSLKLVTVYRQHYITTPVKPTAPVNHSNHTVKTAYSVAVTLHHVDSWMSTADTRYRVRHSECSEIASVANALSGCSSQPQHAPHYPVFKTVSWKRRP